MTVMAAKLLLAPLCVIGVSLAGRRWGMGMAGVLGGLPVVAGPILLVETLLHGPPFGADAAAGALLALAPLTAFVVVFGRATGRLGPIASAFCGWSAFLFGVLVLSFVQPPSALSLIFVGACFAIGLRLLPPAEEAVTAGAAPPRWDLPGRAGAALLLVLGLTALSGALGPHLSGLLAPFPIITSVLAIFTYAHAGVDQVDLLLRNFLLGFYGFAAFCFVLAISLPDFSTAAAFGAAAAAALIVQSAILVLCSRLAPTPLEQGA
jgi:hypothetical protein